MFLLPFLQLVLLPVVSQSLVQLTSLTTVSATLLAANLERNTLHWNSTGQLGTRQIE